MTRTMEHKESEEPEVGKLEVPCTRAPGLCSPQVPCWLGGHPCTRFKGEENESYSAFSEVDSPGFPEFDRVPSSTSQLALDWVSLPRH